MFLPFFYEMREAGIPVSLKGFLKLQQALSRGLVASLGDFYSVARALLVKSERYFDLYDRVFAACFQGAAKPTPETIKIEEELEAAIAAWLAQARERGELPDDELAHLSPEELEDYFRQRLQDQKERHDFGNRWIGTAGTSPVGHGGFHPTGMRVAGSSTRKSALKVAMDRRYRDYAHDGPLTEASMMEALKRLRHMVPHGPKDRVDVQETIRQTMKNAGEIEIVFRQSIRDRLKVILAIDNGGTSMDPYVGIVQTLFDHAKSQFKEVRVLYFHNTIYDYLWEDPARRRRPLRVENLSRLDPQTRLIVVGDASMSPYELYYRNGMLDIQDRMNSPGINQLRFLTKQFPYSVWLNPVPRILWQYTGTIGAIAQIFSMYEISLDGLEKAVAYLMKK